MPKRNRCKLSASQWGAVGVIGAALLGAIAVIVAACIQEHPVPSSTPTHIITPSRVSTSTSTFVSPTPTPVIGKPVNGFQSFPVIGNYHPSGYMGDIGDISIADQGEAIRFTYKTQGLGDQEWDWKYKGCILNPNLARFGGVMFLDPPNNGGNEYGGYDLRGFNTIKWEARSLSDDTYVEFLIGGVRWQWKLDEENNCWVKAPVPYPDSLPRTSLGTVLLTGESQSFQYQLSSLPEDYFRDVLGGFGWTISWGANGVELDAMATPPAPVQPKTILIEVSNIRYEK